MSDNTTSHAQQNMDAWKKIVDQQLELLGSVSNEAAKIHKLGFDKALENIDELHRVSKESFEHAQELADPREQVVAWTELMNRQLEHVVKLNKAWHDAAMDNAKRVAGWMPSSH